MLVALDAAAQRHVACEAPRGPDYSCPYCRQPVVLKRGAKRIPHFAHRPGADCPHQGETSEHLAMKDAVWTALRDLPWVTECELEWVVGERRADVWVRTSDGLRVAVECQVSPLPEEEYVAKVHAYRAHEVNVFYLVHPKALPGYAEAFGVASLEGREIAVPEWVRGIGRRYGVPSEGRSGIGEGDPLWAWTRHDAFYVFLWDRGQVWLARAMPVSRPQTWGGPRGREKLDPRYLPVQTLQRTRRVQVRGPLDLARGFTTSWNGALIPVGTRDAFLAREAPEALTEDVSRYATWAEERARGRAGSGPRARSGSSCTRPPARPARPPRPPSPPALPQLGFD